MTDDASMASELLVAFKEWAILAAVETELKGLIYWWDRHQEVPHTLEESARGLWHLTALVNHADILFTGRRGGDVVEGAVFRAFRDLGVPELGDALRSALNAPATPGGLSLLRLIKRERNSFAHRSYDMDDHGADFAAWGLAPSSKGFEAFYGLIGATEAVLGVIEWRKQSLIRQFFFAGVLSDLEHYIATSAQRAVQQSRSGKKPGRRPQITRMPRVS